MISCPAAYGIRWVNPSSAMVSSSRTNSSIASLSCRIAAKIGCPGTNILSICRKTAGTGKTRSWGTRDVLENLSNDPGYRAGDHQGCGGSAVLCSRRAEDAWVVGRPGIYGDDARV